MNLSLDEHDDLDNMMQSNSWNALMKLMEQALDRQQRVVLNYNLRDGAQGLVEEKARSEGAAIFLKALTNYRTERLKELR